MSRNDRTHLDTAALALNAAAVLSGFAVFAAVVAFEPGHGPYAGERHGDLVRFVALVGLPLLLAPIVNLAAWARRHGGLVGEPERGEPEGPALAMLADRTTEVLELNRRVEGLEEREFLLREADGREGQGRRAAEPAAVGRRRA